jgi:hypothetical protein
VQCVCFIDASCCTTAWDSACVDLADVPCGAVAYRASTALSGFQEVPPVNTSASGTAMVWLTSDDVLRWRIEHSVAGATMAHIHQAAPGANGPVRIGFASPASPIVGEVALSAALKAALLAGQPFPRTYQRDKLSSGCFRRSPAWCW